MMIQQQVLQNIGKKTGDIGKQILLLTIGIYRAVISPFLGSRCRFYPTCSQYAEEAIEKKGALLGSWYALKRILKCHPFHPGGVDVLK